MLFSRLSSVSLLRCTVALPDGLCLSMPLRPINLSLTSDASPSYSNFPALKSTLWLGVGIYGFDKVWTLYLD